MYRTAAPVVARVTDSSLLSPYAHCGKPQRKKEAGMKEMLILVAIIGAWYLLQAYILPKLGVST